MSQRAWRALVGAAAFAGVINLLGLAGPLFMLEIYDRVLQSRSLSTLGALLLLIEFDKTMIGR